MQVLIFALLICGNGLRVTVDEKRTVACTSTTCPRTFSENSPYNGDKYRQVVRGENSCGTGYVKLVSAVACTNACTAINAASLENFDTDTHGSRTGPNGQTEYPSGCIWNYDCQFASGTEDGCCYYNENVNNNAHSDRGLICYNEDLTSAAQDPHVKNFLGESFDILALGEMKLLHLKREKDTVLQINGTIKRLGGLCRQTFISHSSFDGTWVPSKFEIVPGKEGLEICESSICAPASTRFKSQLKVESGKVFINFEHVSIEVTQDAHWGWDFLNIEVGNLHKLKENIEVGGLLGKDDHKNVELAPAGCSEKELLGTHNTPFVSRLVAT